MISQGKVRMASSHHAPYAISETRAIMARTKGRGMLITNNGKHITSKKFKDLCSKWKIDLRFTLVYHSQSNDLTKVMIR